MPHRSTGKKRILIFSASFGGGHRSAAEALLRYYRAHYPDTVEVRMVDFFEEFMPSINVLAKFGYQQSVQFFPALYGNFFDVSNKLPTNPVVHELRTMGFARAAALHRPVPSRCGHLDVSDRRRRCLRHQGRAGPSSSATVITDFGVHRAWLHPATDLYFVRLQGGARGPGASAAFRGTAPWSRASRSPRSSRTQFDRAPLRRELGLADRFTALLTAAAGLPGDLRDIASQLAGWGIQVAAVTGQQLASEAPAGHACAQEADLVKVFGYTNDMHKMMRAADVLVGKAGGLTVSEALAVGLPLIIYNPVPGQELYNVDFLGQLRCGSAVAGRGRCGGEGALPVHSPGAAGSRWPPMPGRLASPRRRRRSANECSRRCASN